MPGSRPVLAALAFAAVACAPNPADRITAEGIRADVAVLSADSMEGRAAGTAGEDRAAAYIASRLASVDACSASSSTTRNAPDPPSAA